MPYRLTASRQLDSRILLLVVLPECGLQGLKQAGIVTGQSFNICITVQQAILYEVHMESTNQLPRSRAVYVSLSLDSLVRPFLPTSPGGADSTNEATVACFEAIVFVVSVCEYAMPKAVQE